jgi:GNAT superfamily N-acetyltransferase
MKSLTAFVTEARQEWHRRSGQSGSTMGHVRVVHKKSGRNIGLLYTEKRQEQYGGDGNWQAHNVSVSKRYRRKGIARMMYDKATERGMEMRPSNAQTDDAFQFWKGYKPEHLKGDLRMVRDKLHGLPVSHPTYGDGKITGVGSRTVTVRKDNGNTYSMSRDKLPQYEHIFKEAD